MFPIDSRTDGQHYKERAPRMQSMELRKISKMIFVLMQRNQVWTWNVNLLSHRLSC